MEEKTNLELQIICEQNGLSNKGGKLEMIERLKAAGVKELEVRKPFEARETREEKPKRGRPKKSK